MFICIQSQIFLYAKPQCVAQDPCGARPLQYIGYILRPVYSLILLFILFTTTLYSAIKIWLSLSTNFLSFSFYFPAPTIKDCACCTFQLSSNFKKERSNILHFRKVYTEYYLLIGCFLIRTQPVARYNFSLLFLFQNFLIIIIIMHFQHLPFFRFRILP